MKKLSNLPDSKLIREVRSAVFEKINNVRTRTEEFLSTGEEVLDLKSLAFGRATWFRFREVEIERNPGLDVIGYVSSLSDTSDKDPVEKYMCCVLADSTTFEACSIKDNVDYTSLYLNGASLGHCVCVKKKKLRFGEPYPTAWELWRSEEFFGTVKSGRYLFFGKIFSETSVAWNSLYVAKENQLLLPIHIGRGEGLGDICKILFRIVSLSPLWKDRKSYVNNDTVIPIDAPELQNKEETVFYFAVNIIFRTLFYSLMFHRGK